MLNFEIFLHKISFLFIFFVSCSLFFIVSLLYLLLVSVSLFYFTSTSLLLLSFALYFKFNFEFLLKLFFSLYSSSIISWSWYLTCHSKFNICCQYLNLFFNSLQLHSLIVVMLIFHFFTRSAL